MIKDTVKDRFNPRWLFTYVDCARFGGNTRKHLEKSKENLGFVGSFKVFQAQTLRTYPRQPCGSVWYHLELQGPTFDQIRQNVSLLFVAIPPKT